MTVHYSSDLHFGHEKVAQLRGFTSVEAHDEHILETILERLGEDDQLWVLGDLTIKGGKSAIEDVMQALCGVAAVIHFVPGNHDKAHPMHRDAASWQEHHMHWGFASVQPFARKRFSIGPNAGRRRQDVLLSHFPYDGEGEREGPDRYTQYRLADEGIPLLHGHTHSSKVISRSQFGSLQIHVGWDAWHRPVTDEEIRQLLDIAIPAPLTPQETSS